MMMMRVLRPALIGEIASHANPRQRRSALRCRII
jgi:hypothetical protein